MERKGRTYEREIRLAGFVLVMVLLGANITLFWLSTRLSRRIQADHSERLALVAELAYGQWQDGGSDAGDQWREFARRWGLSNIGVIGPDGLWLVHSDPGLAGKRGDIPGGMDPGRIRALEAKGWSLSGIYRRDGRFLQSYFLTKKRGSALLVAEKDASAVRAIDRAVSFQTVFVILGSIGALILFAWYLRLVLSPFRQMASQTKAALDGERSAYDSDVEFVLDIYQRVLEDLRSQGRSLKDLYDLSRARAERSERMNKHLLESLDRGVAFADRDGRLVSANRAALALAGTGDLAALEEMLRPSEAPVPGTPDQWTVEIGQGRKHLQVLRSRMEPGDDPDRLTMLLVTDATAQRRMEEQFALMENTRLLRASAEGLLQRVRPELDTVREALEDSGAPALEALQRARQTIEDLGRHLQFAPGQEAAAADDEGLLRQPGMRRVVELVKKVAVTDSTVLISGESGTGKELVARYLHRLSGRREGPFVSINCGALPENLIESELFGYAKGAFTGAYRDKTGLMTAAHGGTFLLDEVAELPPPLQVKLLRVLQEREVVPVGGVKPRSIDIRVVAATNRDLEKMVREGLFRQDLFFRLNIFPIPIPPLRDRIADIGLLAGLLTSKIGSRSGLAPKELEPEGLALLETYDWPGNVRELENVLERALVVSSGMRITTEDLHLPTETEAPGSPALGVENLWEVSKRATSEAERQAIAAALKAANGNKSEAARRLRISYRVILKKIKDYQLDKSANGE
jgi:transcriptional regulator with PAS, ATPase and Fis domain/PAS domain-containing protein